MDAPIRAQLAAPEAIRIELKRMEVEARRRIEELRILLERNPEDARRVVEGLLAGGKLTAKPVTTKDDRRFLLEGSAAVGRLWLGEQRDGSNFASPTRSESTVTTGNNSENRISCLPAGESNNPETGRNPLIS